MTDFELLLADCFDVPPYQLPPVTLHKGMYMLDIEYRGRSMAYGHRHLTKVLSEYSKWVRTVNANVAQEKIKNRLCDMEACDEK